MIDCLYNRSRHHKQIFRSPQLLLTHRDNPFRSLFSTSAAAPKSGLHVQLRVTDRVAMLSHNPIIPCPTIPSSLAVHIERVSAVRLTMAPVGGHVTALTARGWGTKTSSSPTHSEAQIAGPQSSARDRIKRCFSPQQQESSRKLALM